jgi:hypothetical protein
MGVERAIILLGGVGLVAGAALLVMAHAMYAAIPFERTPESVFSTSHLTRLIIHAPIVLVAGAAVAAIAGSLRLMGRGLSGGGRPTSDRTRLINRSMASVFAVIALALTLWYALSRSHVPPQGGGEAPPLTSDARAGR